MKRILTALALILGLGLLKGQENQKLDTVLISSQRIPQTIEQSGRDVTVIEGKDLLDLPIASLDELLRYLPGINVQSRGGFGTQGDISLRGATFAQVLMLIDGVRINDPLTGHFNNYLPLAPSEIKRIEVIYGPSAALYGPDAVGGVIHIITHNFDGSEPQDSFGEAQAGAGQFGFLSSRLGGGVPTKIGYINAGVQFNKADGQPLPPDSNEIFSDFDIRTASISLHKDLDQWQLAARAAYDYRLFSAQYFYTNSPADLSREEVKQFWSQARISRRHSRGKSSLDLAFKSTRDSFLFNPVFPANIHRTRFAFAQFNHTQQVDERISLAFGAQGDYRDIQSTDRGDHNNLHLGVYLTSLLQPSPDFSINASLRGDLDNNYGFELSPQLSLNYRLFQGLLSVRAMGGRAIRAADFTERFISSQIDNLSPGRNIGNPDLRAERAWHGEAGLDLRPVKGLQLSVTGYYRRDNNLIDYGLANSNDISNNQNLLPDSEYLLAQNILSVQSLGLESQLSYRVDKGDFSLNALLGNQLIRTINPSTAATRYLSNRPRFLFSAQVIGAYKGINLALQQITKIREGAEDEAIGGILEDQYRVWNAKLSVQIAQGKLACFLQAHNLTDVEYQDILGARMPRRWLSAGLQMRL